jgi:hypothetical protein
MGHRRFLMGLALVGSGCSAPPGVQSAPTPGPTRTAAVDAGIAAGPFAERRVYRGPCFRARGCYSLTVERDGSAVFMLVDAPMRGRASRDGHSLRFVPDGPGRGETFTTSDDFATLESPTGKFVRQTEP